MRNKMGNQVKRQAVVFNKILYYGPAHKEIGNICRYHI